MARTSSEDPRCVAGYQLIDEFISMFSEEAIMDDEEIPSRTSFPRREAFNLGRIVYRIIRGELVSVIDLTDD